MTLLLFIFDGALIALGIYLKIKSTAIDGYLGERFVTGKLRKLDPQQYTILTNLLIPSTGRTDTAQIDQVVISTYGIFCIETKAHVGRVYGGKHDKCWNTYKNIGSIIQYGKLWSYKSN